MVVSEDKYLKQVQRDHASGRPTFGIPLIVMALVLFFTLPLSIVIHLAELLARALGFEAPPMDPRIARQRRQNDMESAFARAERNYQSKMTEHACYLADRGMLSPEMRRWLPREYKPKTSFLERAVEHSGH
jgi:hypothetical protein